MKAHELAKKLRTDNGLTQSELAERIGSTQAQIHKVESGKRQIKMDYIETLCAEFGLSLPEFFGADPDSRVPVAMDPATLADVVFALDRNGYVQDKSSPEVKADVIAMLYTIAENVLLAGGDHADARAELVESAPKFMQVALAQEKRRRN